MLPTRTPILIKLPEQQSQAQIFLCSDMHCGSAEFDEQKWYELAELLKQDGNYVIFAGDQMEYATRTSKSDVYAQKLRPSEQKRWWITHLISGNLRDKVLCIVDGNHEYNRASKDADDFPLYDIALTLGIQDRYRSEAAFVDIGVGHGGHGPGKQIHYVGRIQHRAQRLANFGTADAFDGIDFFVYGHDHRPCDRPLMKLCYDAKNKAVIEKCVENINCGHFLNYCGYGERQGLRPTSPKLYSLILDGKRKNIETRGFYL